MQGLYAHGQKHIDNEKTSLSEVYKHSFNYAAKWTWMVFGRNGENGECKQRKQDKGLDAVTKYNVEPVWHYMEFVQKSV